MELRLTGGDISQGEEQFQGPVLAAGKPQTQRAYSRGLGLRDGCGGQDLVGRGSLDHCVPAVTCGANL